MRIGVIVFALCATEAFAAVHLEPVSTAEVCGSCHRAIYKAWKKSAHAKAMESRLFQDAWALAKADSGRSAARVCLNCHSPLGAHLGDYSLKLKVSWEGVTCDYCHSVRRVLMTGRNPKAVMEYSLVKSGPLKNVSSPVHGTVYSAVHRSARLCAICHEYQNPSGLKVLTTYSEWKNSRYYKEKIQCQSCHMGRVAGKVVDPRIKATRGAKVNLHEMPGSHSLKQLNKAIRLHLTTVRRSDHLEVIVEVHNAGAGHYVPTGSPMRQLILEVRADPFCCAASGGGQDLYAKRIYRREVADRHRRPVVREDQAFLNGAMVLSDTRLAPDEKRKETFSFAIPQGVPVQVKATLIYYYSPLARTESQQRVVFRTISRLVK